MRIISGLYKGRHFTPPANLQARPTTDFAKEGLFNLLDNRMDLSGINALDLFSGTGSICYELASRGANSVTGIEQNYTHVDYIKKTASVLKINCLQILKADVFKFLETCHTQYDFVFADPPYTLSNLQSIPDLIFAKSLLKEDAWLVIEHGKKTNFSSHEHFIEERNYGNVHFSFFK